MVYGFEIRLRTGRDYGANFKSTTLVVIATSLLNASQGMTRWGYGIAAMIGYSLCFWLMALAMTRIPMGVVYAVWSGVGIVAIASIGWVVFRQNLSATQIGFMLLILIGAIGLNLTTQRPDAGDGGTALASADPKA